MASRADVTNVEDGQFPQEVSLRRPLRELESVRFRESESTEPSARSIGNRDRFSPLTRGS
jgi:hypothetical protein